MAPLVSKYVARPAANPFGPFQKTATLQSNATNAPMVLLRIKGTVLADTHGNGQ